MLFEEEYQAFIFDEHDVLYYAGAALVKKNIICHIIGIKQKDGNIRTYVWYRTPDNPPALKQEKVYSPVAFEKFLASINKKLPHNQLLEVLYRYRPLSVTSAAYLEEEDRHFLHYKYLFEMINGSTRQETYEHIIEMIQQKVKEML